MKWAGINRGTTPVDPTKGAAEYVQNARFTVDGELQRRRGMARTNIAKQSYPIIGLGPAYPPQGSITVFEGNTGQIDGFGFNSTDVAAQWGDVQLKAPTGTITFPVGDANSQKTWDMAALAFYDQTEGHASGDAVKPSATSDGTKTFTVNVTWTNVRLRNQTAANVAFVDATGAMYMWHDGDNVVGYTDAGADSANWDQAPASPLADRALDSGASVDFTVNLTQEFTGVAGDADIYPQIVGSWSDGPGATFPDDYPQNWDISGTVVATFTQTDPDPTDGEYTISITRGDDFATSFDVYAKAGDYPSEPGDGVLVGNVTIDPDEETVQTTWTPPSAGAWAFAAVAKRGEKIGPMGTIG